MNHSYIGLQFDKQIETLKFKEQMQIYWTKTFDITNYANKVNWEGFYKTIQ